MFYCKLVKLSLPSQKNILLLRFLNFMETGLLSISNKASLLCLSMLTQLDINLAYICKCQPIAIDLLALGQPS